MLHFSKAKLFTILATLLIGFMLALPNALPNSFMGVEPKVVTNENPDDLREYREELAKSKESWWPSFFPNKKVNLGLDLQGGVYLLVELDPEEVIGNQMVNARADVTAAFIRQRPQITSKRDIVGGNTLRIELTKPEELATALDRIRDINATLDNTISGARTFDVSDDGNGVITMRMTQAARENFITRAQQRAITIINRRIDPNGVSEITVVPQGENRIVIEAPGEADPQRFG